MFTHTERGGRLTGPRRGGQQRATAANSASSARAASVTSESAGSSATCDGGGAPCVRASAARLLWMVRVTTPWCLRATQFIRSSCACPRTERQLPRAPRRTAARWSTRRVKERKSLEWAELVPEQPDYRVINFALGNVGHSAFFDKSKDLVLSECKGTNKRGNHVRTYGLSTEAIGAARLIGQNRLTINRPEEMTGTCPPKLPRPPSVSRRGLNRQASRR